MSNAKIAADPSITPQWLRTLGDDEIYARSMAIAKNTALYPEWLVELHLKECARRMMDGEQQESTAY